MKRLSVYLLFLWAVSLTAETPHSIWLTWNSDPTTTMQVRWITSDADSNSVIFYRSKTNRWKKAQGRHAPFPDEHPYHIHVADIEGLAPNQEYTFRIGHHGRTYQFQTLPSELPDRLPLIISGDLYKNYELFTKTAWVAAQQSPRFCVFGGDLAYSAPKRPEQKESLERWLGLMKGYYEMMVSPEGHMIPMLVAIGNHEVCGRYNQTPNEARFFYTLLCSHKGYTVFDAGDYLSILLLDSNHTHPIEGDQVDFIKRTLSMRQAVSHKFAVYHVPGFPCVRNFNSKHCRAVRRHWVPLFEQGGVDIAFEHHDHAYKRTFPLRAGKIDPEGVVYIGDGGWGIGPRTPAKRGRRWYLQRVAKARHFILLELLGKERKVSAISADGEILDSSRSFESLKEVFN